MTLSNFRTNLFRLFSKHDPNNILPCPLQLPRISSSRTSWADTGAWLRGSLDTTWSQSGTWSRPGTMNRTEANINWLVHSWAIRPYQVPTSRWRCWSGLRWPLGFTGGIWCAHSMKWIRPPKGGVQFNKAGRLSEKESLPHDTFSLIWLRIRKVDRYKHEHEIKRKFVFVQTNWWE